MTQLRPVALVTGASSGIGVAFARTLAQRGYDLILVARRRERLEQLAQQIRDLSGVATEVIVADLTLDPDLRRVAEIAVSEDRLEMLVNNAGFGTVNRFFEGDAGPQENMHRLHVLATVVLTGAALPGMVARRRGGVINVSSVAGFLPSVRSVSYHSTKAWMIAFTESLHLELREVKSPVYVQALCPGFTHTEFHDAAGMDRSKLLPGSGFWMDPETVVAASLRGLEHGQWLVVPGWRYRLIILALRLIPRFLRHRLIIHYAARTKTGPSPAVGT